ncbi:fatty acid--CoA ligase [Thermodesulforhabdus norvegica]|uniref:Fatty-acyl-CoA synthase n=1 Tax=Thermodesulforhabdus norvegica TaxID=39841 RepID=A0A1I4S9E8_9BACT|nr:fatty acid--CoA ligase [Thermodesulforhabdus norvegica]SFM61108.1 fatty-acyl-CoA synthase [Thermodesulforhabdus norvegica]
MATSVKVIERTRSAYDYPLLIKHLLHTPQRIARDQEIVYRDLKRYTYGEFMGRIGKVANMLKALGVGPGSTVGVMDWDSHRYLECYFAVPMMGAILHTVNVRLAPEQIVYTINHAEDDVLLVHSDFLKLVEMIQPEFTTVKKIVLLQDVPGEISTTLELAGEYEDLVSSASEGYDFPDFDENARATTFYTTGTTGLPKGVYFSHRQLVLHTISVLAGANALKPYGVGFRSDDVYMPITPMFHVHAWGLPYAATMIGVKQVYPGRYEPEMLLRLIEKEKVTFSHCVPTILHMLLSHPASKEIDLSSWRVIIGGSALPEALCKAALDRGIDVYTGYGMSETCPVLTLAHLRPEMVGWSKDEQIPVRCKTGLPVPLVDIHVVDPEGKPLPHDGKSTGEIVVRCPWLTQGYFKETERSEELWHGGWLHTGDVGHIDEKGYLKITDRIKDVIKTGGEWISSLDLENIILKHEAVSEAAAIGVPHEKWGERPVVLVVLKPEYRGKVSEEDLRNFYMDFVDKGVISKWGVPDRILMVDQIPKTSVGKLDKKVMRQQVIDLLKQG